MKISKIHTLDFNCEHCGEVERRITLPPNGVFECVVCNKDSDITKSSKKPSIDEIVVTIMNNLNRFNEINRKLMMHRINPVSKEYLNALKEVNNLGLLPKSTKIILESFSN